MNANKNTLLYIMFFYSFLMFSQEKEDVYFLLDKNNNEYLITGKLNSFTDYITVYNRKEYEYHQNKIKEAKERGNYSFDSEGGRDNLNIHVSKLTFEIKSKKEVEISHCDFYQLKIVDYNWLLTEGWKQINGKEPDTGKPLSFKDIYFLYKINKDKYISYKVGITIVSY